MTAFLIATLSIDIGLRVTTWGLGVLSGAYIQEGAIGSWTVRELLLAAMDLDGHGNRAVVRVAASVIASFTLRSVLDWAWGVISLVIERWQILSVFDNHRWFVSSISVAMASKLLRIHLVALLILHLLLLYLLVLLLLLHLLLSLSVNLLLDIYIILGRCSLLFSCSKYEAWVGSPCTIYILTSVDVSQYSSVLRLTSATAGLTSVSTAVTVVALANWSHNNVLNIVVDWKVDGWFLHHFYLFLSDRTVIVSNHLFDIGLVTLSIGAGYIVIMRVIRLLARRLLPCCTLPGLLGMCSVLARLHSIADAAGAILLYQWLVNSYELIE